MRPIGQACGDDRALGFGVSRGRWDIACSPAGTGTMGGRDSDETFNTLSLNLFCDRRGSPKTGPKCTKGEGGPSP